MNELQHDDRYDDLVMRMAHEAVVRRKTISFPARVRLHSVKVTLKGRVPALAWYAYTLPRLELHPIESEIDPGDRDFNGSSHPHPGWSWQQAETDRTVIIRPRAEDTPAVRKISGRDDRGLIESCVEGWRRSNGMADSGVFEAAAAVGDGSVPSILLSLGLDCLVGVDISGLAVRHASPSAIFSVLFSAACAGGAYGAHSGGGIGRLRAWRSLAGLTGSYRNGGSGEEIEAIAQRLYVV